MTTTRTDIETALPGNGVALEFPFPFSYGADTDLVVTAEVAGQTPSLLVLGGDYSVKRADSDEGGTVIMATPPADGVTIRILRNTPRTQGTRFRNQSRFLAGIHEDAFDHLTRIVQEIVLAGNKGDPGTPGASGAPGKDGADGKDGVNGQNGAPGKDAYAHETTKDLVLNADHGSVDLGLLSQFQKITFSGPGRLRIYVSEAARVADLNRPVAVDATAGTGCLLEVTPNLVDGLGGSLTPLFTAAPEKGGDGLCYWTWEGALGTTCSLEYYNGVVAGTSIIPRDGNTVYQEARDPLPADGVTGDSWLNNLTWDVFHKVAGSWENTGNIKGAQGPQGEKGETGATGAKGDTGEAGAKGDTGAAGLGVPAGGTTGQVLAKKSAADNDTEWVTSSGGGGTTAYSLLDPLYPPATAHALDDEFTADTLSGWTLVNWDGLTSADTVSIPGALRTVNPPVSGWALRCALKVLPDGDFTAWTRVSVEGAYANYHLAGLILADGATAGAGSQYTAHLGVNSAWARQAIAWSGFNSPGGAAELCANPTQSGYIRIRRVGSSYYAAWSQDGRVWTEVSISPATAPTHIGLFTQNNSGRVQEAAFDFFRFSASATAQLGRSRNVLT